MVTIHGLMEWLLLDFPTLLYADAVKILDSRVLVLASAGSGKTYQLGNRILGYIALGADADTIAALTFTRKAAGEFTDSVLSKAANAVIDPMVAAGLERDLRASGRMIGEVNFSNLLEKFVHALPRMVLGTMDGFFTKVVQTFPHEIGIHEGKVRLVEGVEWELRASEVLEQLLGERASPETEAFLDAFRQSNIGREVISVRYLLENFIKEWHQVLRHDGGSLRWGPREFSSGVTIYDWNHHRHTIIEDLRHLEVITTDPRHKSLWNKLLDSMMEHTTGSGVFKANKLGEDLIIGLQQQGCTQDLQIFSYRKPITFPALVCAKFLAAITEMAMSEMARMCQTTEAIRDVIMHFDALCEQKLRRRGLLCFDDVKVLMGQWVRDENHRLLREAMDFRLQARHRHWLLDEFQDTSRADWLGLFPLIDEAATADDGSLFIVGDRKQAIYGWRGGVVQLFDEVEKQYGAGLTREVMRESYRSCSEIIECINDVFGNRDVMETRFPLAAERWIWEEHISAKKELRGHACVKVVAGNDTKEDYDHRLEVMHTDMSRIGAGENELSIAVLVRTNAEMIEVADFLRAHGHQVVEDGQRNPSEDHLIGVSIHQWLRWLADPGDTMALETLRMSPLYTWLEKFFGNDTWQACHKYAHHYGYSALVYDVVMPNLENASSFAQQRCMDAVDCMRVVDATGRANARYAAESFAVYRVAHPVAPAQIQVMTIHKSKGLGFDVVFLPFISNDKIPNEGRFEVARGKDWICKTPPSWVRSMSPEMMSSFQDWQTDQQYEAMCLLYVAFTRSKIGFYAYLRDENTKEKDKPSYANWISSALRLDTSTTYEVGTYENVKCSALTKHQLKERTTKLFPSKTISTAPLSSNRRVYDPFAAANGSFIHEKISQFSWLDEHPWNSSRPEWLTSEPSPQFRSLFSRNNRTILLFREVPIEGIIDGVLMHGIVDRLHLHQDEEQRITKIEIIDFKTDREHSPELVQARHIHQIDRYLKLLHRKWPLAERTAAIVTLDGTVYEIC